MKAISRRSFLQSFISGLGGSSVVAFGISPNLLTSPSSANLNTLDQATFTSKLNSRFQAYFTPTQRVVMTLIAVTDLRASSTQQGEVFSLLLETTNGQAFPQGTYLFKHNQLGVFNMFIVPASSNGTAYRYEALFNRMASA